MIKPISSAIIIAVVIFRSISVAATGDILSSQDFSAFTPSGAAVVESNGGWDNGPYINLVHSSAPSDYTSASFSVGAGNKSEITIVWYEKISVWPVTNTKGIRPYLGSGSTYLGATITGHSTAGGHLYMSSWKFCTITYGTIAHNYLVGYGYPTSNGDGTYAGYYYSEGDKAVALDTDFTTSDGVHGFNSGWRKLRMWIKNSSSTTSDDGATKLWVSTPGQAEELVYSITSLKKGDPGGGEVFTSIKFFPSEEHTAGFAHAYDDITVYEGYVPPSVQQYHNRGSRLN